MMTRALVSPYTDMIRLLAQNDDLRCIYIVGTQDYSTLSGKDQIALSAYFLELFRHREDLYYQHLAGAISSEIWIGFEAATREVVKYSGFRQWLELRRYWFSDAFQAYLESLMSGQSTSSPFDDSGCSSAN